MARTQVACAHCGSRVSEGLPGAPALSYCPSCRVVLDDSDMVLSRDLRVAAAGQPYPQAPTVGVISPDSNGSAAGTGATLAIGPAPVPSGAQVLVCLGSAAASSAADSVVDDTAASLTLVAAAGSPLGQHTSLWLGASTAPGSRTFTATWSGTTPLSTVGQLLVVLGGSPSVVDGTATADRLSGQVSVGPITVSPGTRRTVIEVDSAPDIGGGSSSYLTSGAIGYQQSFFVSGSLHGAIGLGAWVSTVDGGSPATFSATPDTSAEIASVLATLAGAS